jgi:hypothetical protein
MTDRNQEYEAALDTYENSQLSMYVEELLKDIDDMQTSVRHTDSAVILLSWVKDKIATLAKDFKQP